MCALLFILASFQFLWGFVKCTQEHRASILRVLLTESTGWENPAGWGLACRSFWSPDNCALQPLGDTFCFAHWSLRLTLCRADTAEVVCYSGTPDYYHVKSSFAKKKFAPVTPEQSQNFRASLVRCNQAWLRHRKRSESLLEMRICLVRGTNLHPSDYKGENVTTIVRFLKAPRTHAFSDLFRHTRNFGDDERAA